MEERCGESIDALIITAGAGMGVDSGLPDFRGVDGFWKAYPVIRQLGYSFEEMANPKWFEEDPELAWAFYGHRLNLYRQTIPHEGFQLLLEFGTKLNEGCGVITSNVDGHFQAAGFDQDRVEEIHGSIHHFQCSSSVDCGVGIYQPPIETIEIDAASFKAKTIPRCPQCGAVARPNIMMFGDWGWKHERSYEQSSRMQLWIAGLMKSKKNVAIIEVGAGTAIPSIRYTSESLAKLLGARYYRVNPREAEVNAEGISVPMKGLEGIQHVLSELARSIVA